LPTNPKAITLFDVMPEHLAQYHIQPITSISPKKQVVKWVELSIFWLKNKVLFVKK
jgi:hypothetical protein